MQNLVRDTAVNYRITFCDRKTACIFINHEDKELLPVVLAIENSEEFLSSAVF